MISISLEASCLRIANINSCLRIVEAFSTVCSSAKASNSVGVLDLRSWSFISRMRAIPVKTTGKGGGTGREGGRKGIAGLWERSGDLAPEPDATPSHWTGTCRHPPALGEMLV